MYIRKLVTKNDKISLYQEYLQKKKQLLILKTINIPNITNCVNLYKRNLNAPLFSRSNKLFQEFKTSINCLTCINVNKIK